MDARYLSEASAELTELRRQLDEAEQTLRALRGGEVDALVVEGKDGPQVYTLKSAAEPYRMLVEQMHEGALTLSTRGTIVYCNEAFARIAGKSAKDLIGRSVIGLIAHDEFQRLAGQSGTPAAKRSSGELTGAKSPYFCPRHRCATRIKI